MNPALAARRDIYPYDHQIHRLFRMTDAIHRVKLQRHLGMAGTIRRSRAGDRTKNIPALAHPARMKIRLVQRIDPELLARLLIVRIQHHAEFGFNGPIRPNAEGWTRLLSLAARWSGRSRWDIDGGFS